MRIPVPVPISTFNTGIFAAPRVTYLSGAMEDGFCWLLFCDALDGSGRFAWMGVSRCSFSLLYRAKTTLSVYVNREEDTLLTISHWASREDLEADKPHHAQSVKALASVATVRESKTYELVNL